MELEWTEVKRGKDQGDDRVACREWTYSTEIEARFGPADLGTVIASEKVVDSGGERRDEVVRGRAERVRAGDDVFQMRLDRKLRIVALAGWQRMVGSRAAAGDEVAAVAVALARRFGSRGSH